MSRTVLCTPLLLERAALRRVGPSMRLVRTGMGPRRASRTAAALARRPAPVLVAGLGGALTPHVRPGDVVVASEVRTGIPSAESRPGRVEVASAPLLAGALGRLGLTVHVGAVRSVPRISWVPVADGALAVDMESAQLAAAGSPFAVVRAVVDTPDHPLWHLATLRHGVAALRALRACQPALEWWAAATGRRAVLLGGPRSVRAIASQVELALVAGSPESVRVARRAGAAAYLVGDTHEIDLRWLAGTTRLGIIAGACAPPGLVARIVHCLGGLGPVSTTGSWLIDPGAHLRATREVV